MQALQYPFDSADLRKHRKKYRRELLAEPVQRIPKRIAVLGGSTTADICAMLELFLLAEGIAPTFYESEYGQYWQDAMFPNATLAAFSPELIFIHTTQRNITEQKTELNLTAADCAEAVEREYQRFAMMWEQLAKTYHCPVIQNNFELPGTRLLGNADASDCHGRTRFITRLNEKCYQYAETHSDFYIHDIHTLSAQYGLDEWLAPSYWYLYKYALCMPAIPLFAYQLSRIIKSIFGKNKKALALDLDNTLWGGVIGDDGQEGIEIGQETHLGQAYSAFQQYLKSLQSLGVLLTVCSKNEPEAAALGLAHPDNILHAEDFAAIFSNWQPKDRNIAQTAEQLQILPESMVFVDDNPAERAIVRGQLPDVAVPELTAVETYIRILDHSGFFEMTGFSADDLNRNAMYRANAQRAAQQSQFADYHEYLLSLEMTAEIAAFTPLTLQRIVQLTNKSNQFNLTTRRYTESEMQQVMDSPNYLTFGGRLADKFGDNGIVSVVVGKICGSTLELELWLMSCRVLKRDMELAMLDEVVAQCKQRGIRTLLGTYIPSTKNRMVESLYDTLGFTKCAEAADGTTTWQLPVAEYQTQNHVIQTKQKEAAYGAR